MPRLIAPVDVSPAATGSWQDVDISSQVGADAGAVALALLRITNTDTGYNYAYGLRRNGSTDPQDGLYNLDGGTWTVCAVGVDAGDVFEAWINGADVIIELIGWATTAEAGALTNRAPLSHAAAGWQDVDISSLTGADTAVLALGDLAADGSQYWDLRRNGSSDPANASRTPDGQTVGWAAPCDAAEIFEWYWSTADRYDTEVRLIGWLTANCTAFTNRKNYSTGTVGSYVDVDFSTDIPAGNSGAIFHFITTNNYSYLTDIRKNGSSDQNYYDTNRHVFGLVGLDGNRVAEQKIESISVDLFLLGHTAAPAGGTPQTAALSLDAAVAAARSAAAGLAAALRAIRAANAGLDAALRGTAARTTGLDGVLCRGGTGTAILDGALRQGRQAGTGLAAALRCPMRAGVALAAALRGGQRRAVALDAAIGDIAAGGRTRLAPILTVGRLKTR